MKILADYHHHDLWESLELLCARFGWQLYRPMGMDWYDEGYWNFERQWHGDAVARQYLMPWDRDLESYTITDMVNGHRATVVGERHDPSHDRWIRLWTLEQARDIKPDVVLASVAHNHEGFARFARETGAAFGLHLGNVRFAPWDMDEDRWDLADFGIVTSVMPGPIPKPHVVVHQEFSLDDFHPGPRTEEGPVRVSSFVNCFPENPMGYHQFRETAEALPDLDWRIYGAYGSAPEDEYAAGNLNVCADVAERMRQSDIAWHTKMWSDGFGHVIHNWFAVGRPVLGHAWYYANQLAGPLWVEGRTSIDIGAMSRDEVIATVRDLAQDEARRLRMSENAARRFREVVDFDADAEAVRGLVESAASRNRILAGMA